MLNEYCATVLTRELTSADYDSLTSNAAWSWLMDPVKQPPSVVPTGIKITAISLARTLGAPKAEAIVKALKLTYPTIGELLITEGIDPLTGEAQTFIANLVKNGILSSPADTDAITAAVYKSIPLPDLPRRFESRFAPDRWPRVNSDGSVGDENAEAISGFPNTIERVDFDAAWKKAGRS